MNQTQHNRYKHNKQYKLILKPDNKLPYITKSTNQTTQTKRERIHPTQEQKTYNPHQILVHKNQINITTKPSKKTNKQNQLRSLKRKQQNKLNQKQNNRKSKSQIQPNQAQTKHQQPAKPITQPKQKRSKQTLTNQQTSESNKQHHKC